MSNEDKKVYETDEFGTYIGEDGLYSGPRPNESEKAKEDLADQKWKERKMAKKLEKLLKKQSKLRHAGY